MVISSAGIKAAMTCILPLVFATSLVFASEDKPSEEQIIVGNFSSGDLSFWKDEEFEGITSYSLVEFDGHRVLKAQSQGTASGKFKKVKIDLHKTPYLYWTWRVENTLGPLNETGREGDDYPARVYVVVSGGLFFWKTMALNYVWSSSQSAGSRWDNAYTNHAKMIALQGGESMLGQWLVEKRNIREDFKKQFGKDVRYIDVVAVMTDTDNSGSKAIAYYGDIYFSDQ